MRLPSLILLLSVCTAASPPPPSAAAGPSSPAPPPVPAGMVRIPEGPFMMGCAPHDGACRDAERPYREVRLATFDIDRLEVTIADYRRCVAAGACTTADMTHEYCLWGKAERDDLPINCIRWLDAAAYCAWAGKRLPSEAEWEKAARGTDSRIYPWGNDPPDGTRANLCDARCAPNWPRSSPITWDDGHEGVAPVGSYPAGASPYGVLDMIGNLGEHVQDWVEEDEYANIRGYSAAAAQHNSTGATHRWRAIRGADYYVPMLGWERVSARNAGAPTSGDFKYGIRCARSPAP